MRPAAAGGGQAEHLAVRAGEARERRVDHQAGLLLDRHLRDEVGHAPIDGQPPVLVWIERAVLEVAELQSVLGEDGDLVRLDLWLRGGGERRAEEECQGTHDNANI